ncbi:hypothetical protein G6F70_000780 [Rhizopus microsporus]|nr:hypothetical protein G6F71_000519 [Rhizopus microsporus]KAG1204124.1 hypothetical protein G6F70_000780 [Rhizopus microsporus]KAG1215457.1 hypothetical protein G6F69_000975 [Rhizopus microsporus]KAG1238005.1 hypothetical protein G6F67_000745 [Rhizopus microsporus]KAG1269322.1 hypothetical protein G6F68_000399 [Rhizopus microsporus]
MYEQVQAGGTSQAGNSSQPTDNNISSEVQHIFAEAKDFNVTIKKSVIAQFSTNLDIMYKNGERLKSAIEKTLRILLKLHIQPKKERIRRKYINELQTTSDASHTVVTENSIFSRNKKRSLLNKYRKQLHKYQEKNKTTKADKIARKIEHIKELQWKKKPKRKKAVAKVDNTDQDVETVIEEDDEVNISGRRLAKLKGILKSPLYNHDAEMINKQDIEISDLSEKEFSVPQPSSLLCLPLDTAMLYTLLTSYGEQMFDLVCKNGVKISTRAMALNEKQIILVRPGLVNCILTGVSLKTTSATATSISSKQSAVIPSLSEESQPKEKRLKDLKEEITTLSAQLLKKKEAFSLEKIDKEIRKMKKERNGMADKDSQVLCQELKALRREEYTCRNVYAKTYYYSLRYTLRKQHSDDSVDLPTELKQTRFSGTDYGLKTMSVTVPISMKMFNTHLNLYNKFHPDNSL